MPSSVPAPLATLAARLRCPICHKPLAPSRGSLRCPTRHTYDVARSGYVTLAGAGRRIPAGDDAEMVAARVRIQAAGHFDPLSDALVAEARQIAPGCATILDAGAGTGHHLIRLVQALTGAHGIALDASRQAARRAARAHPRVAAVRCDVWEQIPLDSAAADLALCVFAPRNGAEFARILRPGGVLIVVTPTPTHLRELATLHDIRVDPRKTERLYRQLAPSLRVWRSSRLEWTMQATRSEIGAMLRMGPAGRHRRPGHEQRLDRLPEPIRVTAGVELRTFQRPSSSRSASRRSVIDRDTDRAEAGAGTRRARRSARRPKRGPG